MRGDVKLGPKVLIFIGVSLVVILGISFALMLKQREREAMERTSHLMEHVVYIRLWWHYSCLRLETQGNSTPHSTYYSQTIRHAV